MSTRPQATAAALIDNERVIVTEWRFPIGAQTGWHRHAHDYVVVPQTTGKLLLETEQGHQVAELAIGKPYFRNAGVQHNVINGNDYEFVFIEIELR
jgi:beta-alanine degradation protein BauB